MSNVQLYLGDCLDVLRTLPDASVDAVVTDPPYGVNQNSDNTRFPSRFGVNKAYRQIANDERPFDPTPWLGFPSVAMFGANCYSNRLPIGSWLVWCKRREAMFGEFLADAEVAWTNKGFGIYMFQHEWHGALRDSEKGATRLHPHQKPVAVMEWVIRRLNLKPGATILDPYMGSGTTGIAAMRLGHRFIGCELDPRYHAIAERRIAEASERQSCPLFDNAPEQANLFA